MYSLMEDFESSAKSQCLTCAQIQDVNVGVVAQKGPFCVQGQVLVGRNSSLSFLWILAPYYTDQTEARDRVRDALARTLQLGTNQWRGKTGTRATSC